MLLHRIIGIARRSRRPVAFAAAAPVDADHTHAAGKQRRGDLDPLLAGEIAMEKDDGDVALTPCAPSEMHLAGPYPRHNRAYLFRPTVGDVPVGISCAGAAAAVAPLIK